MYIDIYIKYIYIIQHELRGIDRASKNNDFATSFHRGFVHGTFLEILEFLLIYISMLHCTKNEVFH